MSSVKLAGWGLTWGLLGIATPSRWPSGYAPVIRIIFWEAIRTCKFPPTFSDSALNRS